MSRQWRETLKVRAELRNRERYMHYGIFPPGHPNAVNRQVDQSNNRKRVHKSDKTGDRADCFAITPGPGLKNDWYLKDTNDKFYTNKIDQSLVYKEAHEYKFKKPEVPKCTINDMFKFTVSSTSE